MNKYSITILYKERSEKFVRRAIPLLEFMKPEEDFSKELSEFEERLFTPEVDGGDIASYAMDYAASLAEEYMLLSDGIYSAVLTSLYHLWERDIRDLCKHKSSYDPITRNGKKVLEQNIQNYDYETLKSLLMYWGAQGSIFHDVNILRLVVNTIKHGRGPSAKQLLESNRGYYCKLAMFCSLEVIDCQIDYEELDRLGINDIKHFGTALSTFWALLGENISA